MFSFTGLKQLCKDLTQDTSTAADTFFATHINTGLRILETQLDSFYTEETATVATIASTNSYKTPADFIRLKDAYITISNTRYDMDEVVDEEEWQSYQVSQASNTSDILQKIIVRRDNFEVYPTPATASLTMTLRYEAGNDELIAADYTTGTVTTLANGSAALTASGTTFTSAMAGRYIKITSDGIWYKIASFGTTTTLTLDKNYEGLSISAGSEAFILGEMPRTPESTHQIPAYYAVREYYMGFKQSISKADYYRRLYNDELKRAKRTFGRRYSSKYLAGRRTSPINPNHYPSGLTT